MAIHFGYLKFQIVLNHEKTRIFWKKQFHQNIPKFHSEKFPYQITLRYWLLLALPISKPTQSKRSNPDERLAFVQSGYDRAMDLPASRR